ncbi:MAG: hypothetical protein ACK46X_04925 [Candidatus Sericytochromatia bacterium]
MHLWSAKLDLPTATHRVELLAPRVTVEPLGQTRAAVTRVDWEALATTSQPALPGLSCRTAAPVDLTLHVMRRAERIPPLGVSGRAIAALALGGDVHELSLDTPIRVRRDLAAVRERLVERRGVPARLLRPDQVTHWQKRVGDSKRVPARLVELVAVFPNVPIVGDQPVQYANGALSYALPGEAVPLTTVVIAKHATSGTLLLGRFAAS